MQRIADESASAKIEAHARPELAPYMDRTWFTNLSNASAVLMDHFPRLNWAGFYLVHGNELRLGPFQGKPACLKIAIGRGVCGTAALGLRTIVVDNVDEFPGHIACDSRSRSEIVVPLIKGDRLLGVMDLDSPELARFTDEDRQVLESVARELVELTEWPVQFA